MLEPKEIRENVARQAQLKGADLSGKSFVSFQSIRKINKYQL